MRLEDKVVFISGGGGGIGGGMAQAFAEQGAKLVLADINLNYVEEEAAKLPSGTDVQTALLDVTSLESWATTRQAVEERFGRVDVLCNNAGISFGFRPLVDVAPEDFERVIAVNVTGVYYGVLTFGRQMAERGSGHIVNTSSLNGLIPFVNFATYSASKFAVLGMSDSLRQELAPSGVGVSTLFPGLTRSRMSEAVVEEMASGDPQRAAQIRANMMDPVWLGRAVVRAVENDEPYIITHPEHLAATKERFGQILAAFGDPAQPGYQARTSGGDDGDTG
jgi:NAD(P)-dependent dehydrogenase (short-subunit alcohol dehydrogenase family)